MTIEDPGHPEPPPGWLHMRTAPKAGRYRVFNPMTGPYTTEPKDGEWPMVGWGDTQGRFYPTPYGWLPIEDRPMNIITRNVCPPIPDRRLDWEAYDDDTYDGPGCPVGTGATEADAVADLLEKIGGAS